MSTSRVTDIHPCLTHTATDGMHLPLLDTLRIQHQGLSAQREPVNLEHCTGRRQEGWRISADGEGMKAIVNAEFRVRVKGGISLFLISKSSLILIWKICFRLPTNHQVFFYMLFNCVIRMWKNVTHPNVYMFAFVSSEIYVNFAYFTEPKKYFKIFAQV